jgi:DNA-binding NarL/FixJ family response regulator
LLVAELNPDVVILDLQMPVMNGVDAAREIGRKAPNIPMLMLTMNYSEQLLKAAEAVGNQRCLLKNRWTSRPSDRCDTKTP